MLVILPFSTALASSPAGIQDKIDYYAEEYGLNTVHFRETIRCESGFDPRIKNPHEDSYGLAQIYLPAHPEIVRSQATDPDFALEFMARAFSTGKAYWWSCWNELYGSQ